MNWLCLCYSFAWPCWESVRLACGRSGFDPQSRQIYFVNTSSDSSTAKARQHILRVLGDDKFIVHIKGQWSWVPIRGSKFGDLQGNCDVSVWLKMSQVERKPPNKQKWKPIDYLLLSWCGVFKHLCALCVLTSTTRFFFICALE